MDTASTETEEVKFPTDEKIKMSKVEKFFKSQKEKFQAHMKGSEDHFAKKLNEFASSANDSLKRMSDNIQKMDNKFSGMYSILSRKFVQNIEDRVYTLELANKTMLMMLCDRLHPIEGSSLSKEEFAKQLEAEYLEKMTTIHKENEEALAKDSANEQANTVAQEPVQKEEACDSVN